MDLNICIEVVLKLYEGSCFTPKLSIIHDLSSEYSIKNNIKFFISSTLHGYCCLFSFGNSFLLYISVTPSVVIPVEVVLLH